MPSTFNVFLTYLADEYGNEEEKPGSPIVCKEQCPQKEVDCWRKLDATFERQVGSASLQKNRIRFLSCKVGLLWRQLFISGSRIKQLSCLRHKWAKINTLILTGFNLRDALDCSNCMKSLKRVITAGTPSLQKKVADWMVSAASTNNYEKYFFRMTHVFLPLTKEFVGFQQLLMDG